MVFSMSERGFTLLELCITIAMMFLLLATGVPSVSSMKRQLDSTENARAFVHVLGELRAEAIRTKSPVRITFSETGFAWDLFDDGNVDGSYTFHETVAWVDAVPDPLVFNGFGLIPALDGSETLRLGNAISALDVTLNSNGHVAL